MPNPIIHIGFPKTGTTWFYDSYYQKIRNIINPAPESFIEHIADPSFVPPAYDPHKRLVLHHPELTGIKRFIWDKGIRRDKIAHNLKKNYPDATIIVFIRNQIDFLTSAYIYYVRKGGTYPPKEMIDLMIMEKMELTLDYMKYNEMIDLYVSLFGKDKVDIYLFEDFCSGSGTFISDYSRRYAFDITAEQIDFSPVNDKMRYHLMKCMRLSNYFTKRENPLKTYYLNCEWIYNHINSKYGRLNRWKVFGRKVVTDDLFRPDQIKYFNEYYGAGNRQLVEKHGLTGIIKYGYPMSE